MFNLIQLHVSFYVLEADRAQQHTYLNCMQFYNKLHQIKRLSNPRSTQQKKIVQFANHNVVIFVPENQFYECVPNIWGYRKLHSMLNILQGDVSKRLFSSLNLSLKTYKYLKLCEKHLVTKKFKHQVALHVFPQIKFCGAMNNETNIWPY